MIHFSSPLVPSYPANVNHFDVWSYFVSNCLSSANRMEFDLYRESFDQPRTSLHIPPTSRSIKLRRLYIHRCSWLINRVTVWIEVIGWLALEVFAQIVRVMSNTPFENACDVVRCLSTVCRNDTAAGSTIEANAAKMDQAVAIREINRTPQGPYAGGVPQNLRTSREETLS